MQRIGKGVEIRVAGCGDAFGSGGRFQTCFVVDDGLGRFVLDFGVTSLAALQHQAIDPDSIDLVLISHMHGDHVGGLPFLLLQRAFASREKRPLTIAGPPGFEAQLKADRREPLSRHMGRRLELPAHYARAGARPRARGFGRTT